jgi:hypothetical protein
MIKTCQVCGNPFTPDPRVGDCQIVCKEISCQLERKRRAQKKWLKENPDYFKGRYPELKERIIAYQEKRRLERINLVEQYPLDIQDELNGYKSKALTMVQEAVSIQDEITSKITLGKSCLRQALDLIYKTSQPNVILDLNCL